MAGTKLRLTHFLRLGPVVRPVLRSLAVPFQLLAFWLLIDTWFANA